MRVLKYVAVFAALTLVAGTASANVGSDVNLIEAAKSGGKLLVVLKTVASLLFLCAGAYWSGKGLLEVIKATNQRSDESPLNGLAKAGLGTALIALPWVTGMTANTFLGGGGSTATNAALEQKESNINW